MSELTPVRPARICEDAVVIDGIGGCAKTMLSAVVASLDRIELLNYSYEIEQACILQHFGLMTMGAAAYLVQYELDLILYNVMMGRDVNFRFSDLSSVFNSGHRLRYLKRIVGAGDQAVPARIAKERPILHLATHAISGFMEPIMRGAPEGLLFINMHRDPLFMLKQNTWNQGNLVNNERHFGMYFERNGQRFPFFFTGREEMLMSASPKERAILVMEWLRKRSIETTSRLNSNRYYELTFESLVLNPRPIINRICEFLRTKETPATARVLKKERIPRTLLTDGRARSIYRRVGWSKTEGSTREDEVEALRVWAYDGISDEARAALDWLRADYEQLSQRLDGAQ